MAACIQHSNLGFSATFWVPWYPGANPFVVHALICLYPWASSHMLTGVCAAMLRVCTREGDGALGVSASGGRALALAIISHAAVSLSMALSESMLALSVDCATESGCARKGLDGFGGGGEGGIGGEGGGWADGGKRGSCSSLFVKAGRTADAISRSWDANPVNVLNML